MATTITVIDVQTDPVMGMATIVAEFDSGGHKWTQGFSINPSVTNYMTKPEEYVELIKTVLRQHAIEVTANLDELNAKQQWKFADNLKGLTFTTDK